MDNQYNNQEIEQEESFINIDFKKLFADILKMWWLFALSIGIAIVLNHMYNRYAIPVYSSNITVILDDQSTNNGPISSSQSMMEGFMVDPGMRNIDNQVAVLQSRTAVTRVVDKMNIYVSFYHKGRIATTEMYGFSGFSVVFDSTHVQPLNLPIFISDIDGETYNLVVHGEHVNLFNYKTREYEGKSPAIDCDIKCKYGEPIVTPWGAFSIVKNANFGSDIYFTYSDPEALVAHFRGAMNVYKDDKSNSSVVEISISGPNVAKNNDYLNTLVGTFIEDNLAQKNLIAESTIRFIEDQLGSLSDSLVSIGSQLSSFKVSHGLQQPLSAKGESIFKELQSYEKEIQQQLLVDAYYDYLKSYFSNDSILTGVIAPAVFDTKSKAIEEQLSQIMTLNAEKQAYQETFGKPSNPVSQQVIAKLQIARNTLLQSIDNHKKMVKDNVNELKNKVKESEKQLSTLPETERLFLGIDRKYTLNSDVYTYLMRKRSESQIQKASNTPDHRILDSAAYVGQVSPNYGKNRTMSLALAIILPLAFLVLRQLLDTKVRTQEDVKKITQLPILGEISSSNKDTSLVVLEHPKSIIAEMFRRMRTRVEFMIAGKETPVIGVTSSMPGEGKTFCALNMASVFSISGKKTVLLGFDLRKPGLNKVINTSKHQAGLSNYIIGDSTLEEITINYSDNLDVLPAGVIPPNPAELIASERCTELIDILKRKYDVVVIDTPPMGLVSDAYMIARWLDALLFVVRQDYTMKDSLKYTVATFEEEGIKHVGLIVNDVDNAKSRYGYGYGHYGHYGKYGKKYGYGGYYAREQHGYYAEE